MSSDPTGARRPALERDAASRRLAQREFSRPVALEAGAGTGKTTTLVARVLAWSLGPGWDRAAARLTERARSVPGRPDPDEERIAAAVLGGVVAITFTEAAAAEMASRIGKELAGIARGDGWPGWLEEPLVAAGATADRVPREIAAVRARALAATLDHLTVRTIHAWCLGLLTDHPLEAGIHPQVRVDADGRRLEEIVRETVEGHLRSAYGASPDEDFLTLAARGIGPAELAGALTTLVAAGMPAGGLDPDPLGPDAVARLLEQTAAALSDLDDRIASRLDAGRLAKAREAAAFLAALRSRVESVEQNPAGLAALLDEVREGAPPVMDRLRDWGRGKLTQAEGRAFEGEGEEVAAASAALHRMLGHLLRLDLELLAVARRALAPLLDEVRGQMRSHGLLTFQDLLQETASLLSRRRDVAAGVQRRIDQLLVDEFQDTDRRQCEILRRIALEGPAADRPGLFLVGDPKQSIYGWREADLAAYEGFLEEVRADGGEVHPLVQNFRSVPAVLDEVTRVVEPVMRPIPGLQPPFEALVPTDRLAAVPGFATRDHAPIEHWISWRGEAPDRPAGAPVGEKTRNADADEVEAAAIARDLRRLHDEHGVAWTEMALLFRATTRMETYLAALRHLGVPFLVRGDKQYYRRREIIEAAALVRAVIDPGDHVALLTVLRSAWVGVPDAALVPLWRRGLPRRATELGAPEAQLSTQLDELETAVAEAAASLPPDIPGLDRLVGWETSLLAALEHLARARESFRRDPGDHFVELLRDLFLAETIESARYLGGFRLANLERFFADLAAALAGGEGDVAGLLRLLRRSVAEALEAPEGQPQLGSEDAVRVLTIHAAKGLEFAHVYLPQLHRKSRRLGPPAVEAAATAEGYELRLFGAPTLGFDRVATMRERVETAERVRLLYVAMTRAKERLVMAGRWPAALEPPAPEDATSLLDLLLSRREPPPPPGELWEELRGGDETWRTDDAGALWRLPDLEAPGEDLAIDPGAAPDAARLPTPEVVAAGTEELRARRQRAAVRSRRRHTTAASEEAHHRLRELEAERAAESRAETDRGEPEAAAGTGRDASRRVRLAVGSAVHGWLEHFDPEAEPGSEHERLRGRLRRDLGRDVPPELFPAALEEAESFLDRLEESPLLERLRALSGSIVARELPLLLPPAGDGPEDPVGAVAGFVDLVYRDPESGRLVVADYKTDRVRNEEEIDRRAAAYRAQGAVYTRAVREALGLAETPRFELWFLAAGRIVEVIGLPGP